MADLRKSSTEVAGGAARAGGAGDLWSPQGRPSGGRMDRAHANARGHQACPELAEGTADWVIDLGPEGGDKGGEIVAEGTREDVAREARSYTGGLFEGHSR